MGVHLLETLEEHCAGPSQSTKFWALQNKLVYTASEYTTAFTEFKQKETSNKAYAITPDAVPRCHITLRSWKKNLQNLILTQEQRVLVIRNTILTEWGYLSSLQKSHVLEHLEKKKSPCAIKNKSVLEVMGDLPCFVFYIVQD